MESKLDYYKKRAYAYLYYVLETQDNVNFFKVRKNELTKPMRKRTSAYCELWIKK